jgi:hypothetical protein
VHHGGYICTAYSLKIVRTVLTFSWHHWGKYSLKPVNTLLTFYWLLSITLSRPLDAIAVYSKIKIIKLQVVRSICVKKHLVVHLVLKIRLNKLSWFLFRASRSLKFAIMLFFVVFSKDSVFCNGECWKLLPEWPLSLLENFAAAVPFRVLAAVTNKISIFQGDSST